MVISEVSMNAGTSVDVDIAVPPCVIVVATTVGCPHCARVKKALTENGFDYASVDMSAKPSSSLVELKRLTGRGTVPQVFVGGRLVGGADETVGMIEDGSLRRTVDGLCADMEDRGVVYADGIAEVLFGGDDEDEDGEGGFLEELMGLRALRAGGRDVNELMAASDRGTREKLLGWRVVVEENSETYGWSEDVGVVDAAAFRRFGKARPLNGHLRSVSNGLNGQNAPQKLDDPVRVSSRLRTILLALYDDHLTSNGSQTAVDYVGLRNDPRFRAYVDLSAALDDVDLSLLTSKEAKMAFWINTYNSLIVHAVAVVGPAETTLQRLTWFDRVAYRIGGMVFSADDIEHGVLRGNASPPASLLNLIGLKKLASAVSPAFAASDPRRACSLSRSGGEVDPRIHFALNCGAKSCPAIKVYREDVLEEGLRGAAEAFCEEQVRVREDGTVEMSSILKWYGGDFGDTQAARLRYLLPYVGEATRGALEGMSEAELAACEVVYSKYDWGLND